MLTTVQELTTFIRTEEKLFVSYTPSKDLDHPHIEDDDLRFHFVVMEHVIENSRQTIQTTIP